MSSSNSDSDSVAPSTLRLIIGFLAVGLAWGFTTPFIRRAARNAPIAETQAKHGDSTKAGAKSIGDKGKGGIYATLVDYVRRPAYTVPLVLNLSGSALFFLIVGQAELSLTVPITNSLAFLFTVLGEYVAEGKAISNNTWLGMALVLSGIAICVHSKS